MMRDPSKAPAKLLAACQVFTDLGWTQVRREYGEQVDVQQVLELPLGTPDQQKLAREALARGAWGSIGEFKTNSYGWIEWLPEGVDSTVLAWFALRVGVDAKRAHSLGLGWQDDLAIALVESRGDAFVRSYLAQCSSLSDRTWEHSASGDAVVALSLVHRHTLPIPEHLGYLKDWAIHADAVLGGPFHESELRFGRERAAPELIEARFAEHARVAVRLGLAATGPFGEVLVRGVARGWLNRDEAVDMAFSALDAAQRPGDRKAWAAMLTGPLAVSNAELLARVDTLIAVLSAGESVIVEAFAPRLLAIVPDDLLLDLALVSLTGTTKKVRKLVLSALAGRSVDADTVAVLGPIVVELEADRTLAPTARHVLTSWEFTPEAEPDTESDTEAAEEVRGLWQAPPALWEVPVFTAGPATAAGLADVLGQLVSRPESGIHDIETERFLVLCHALAHHRLDDLRSVLKALKRRWDPGLAGAQAWVQGEVFPSLEFHSDRDLDPLEARESQLFDRLDDLPVLLSEPTWEDFGLDPTDLVARLERYAAESAVASEADLLLATTRLDPTLVTEQHRAELKRLAVPARGLADKIVIQHAGNAVLRYLDDPIVEPRRELGNHWRTAHATSGSNAFPNRFKDGADFPGAAVFPLWQDLGEQEPDAWPDAAQGVRMRHLAHSRRPLSPRLAGGFVRGLRNDHPNAQADQHLAITQAWQRGLLVPGVADVVGDKAEGLAAIAKIGADLAEQGMLAWVWPVLADLADASAVAPRMLAGTAEVLEQMIALWPEVAAAVASGLADSSAAALPGVQVLAQRKGTSRAVALARTLASLLPEVPESKSGADALAMPPRMETSVAAPFNAQPWEALLGLGVCDDRAELRARWLASRGKSRFMAVEFTPFGSTQSYVDAATWTYPMEREGQLCAEPVDLASPASQRQRWFRWDPENHTLIMSEQRNWAEGTDGPLPGGRHAAPALSTTAAALLLGSLCHDQRFDTAARELLSTRFHPETVRLAMSRLLASNGDLVPARMVRVIENEVNLLAALWPVLTESIAHAAHLVAGGEKLPSWLNRVLDVALLHADSLRSASAAGLISAPYASWPGLSQLGALQGKSTAVAKARELQRLLSVD